MSLLDEENALLVEGACDALGEIGRRGALPVPDNSDDTDIVTKLTIVTKVVEKVKPQEKVAKKVGYSM